MRPTVSFTLLNRPTRCMDKYIATYFILRRKIWYSTIAVLSTRLPRGGGKKMIASEWRRFLDMWTTKNNAIFSTQGWRIQAKTWPWRLSILSALLDDTHVSLWEKNNLVRVDDQWRKGGCSFFLKFWHVPLTCGGVMVVVTTQIPGDSKFGLWPQVKGLTLRVSPIPRWQSTKTLWFFIFFYFTYKSH